MGNCQTINFMEGGTLKDVTIINPDIHGGTATALEIINGRLTGALTIDAAAAQSIADAIADYLASRLALFTDCDGTTLDIGTAIVTCAAHARDLADIRHEIEDATAPAVVAATFNDCAGNPLSPGTALATCEYMEMYVRLYACENCTEGGGGGEGFGDIITDVAWDGTGTTMNISVRYVDGSTHVWPLDFSDFWKSYVESAAPPSTEGTALPTVMIGGRNLILGDPLPDGGKWILVPGTDPPLAFPAYLVEIPT